MRPVLLAAAVLATTPASAQELTQKTFDTWYKYIIPKESELTWRKIGWRPTLGEAWIEAQKQDKPILFWAMNGHPLGCT
jgi:hypothetical protein